MKRAGDIRQALERAGLIRQQTTATLEAQMKLKQLERDYEAGMAELMGPKEHGQRQAKLTEDI